MVTAKAGWLNKSLLEKRVTEVLFLPDLKCLAQVFADKFTASVENRHQQETG
jgi:hypothetical protein